MKTIELSNASKPLSEYTDELQKELIVLLLHNTPIAAIVSLKDDDLESLALSANPDFYDIIARSRQEFAEGKTLSLDEMKHEVANMS